MCFINEVLCKQLWKEQGSLPLESPSRVFPESPNEVVINRQVRQEMQEVKTNFKMGLFLQMRTQTFLQLCVSTKPLS